MLQRAERPIWRSLRKTGASTATISRVNRSLNYGNDGYEMVFSRLKENRIRKKVKRPMRRFAFSFPEKIPEGYQ